MTQERGGTRGNAHTDFWELIAKAMAAQAKHTEVGPLWGTEENPATYGGIEFWRDESGAWCYSPPTTAWDLKRLNADLVRWLSMAGAEVTWNQEHWDLTYGET